MSPQELLFCHVQYQDKLKSSIEIKGLDDLKCFTSYELNAFITLQASNIAPDFLINNILPYKMRFFDDSIIEDLYNNNYKDELETFNLAVYQTKIPDINLSYYCHINLNGKDLVPNGACGLSYHFSNGWNVIGISYASIISLTDYNYIYNLYYINHDHNLLFDTEITGGILSKNYTTPAFWSSLTGELGYNIDATDFLQITPALRALILFNDLSALDNYSIETSLGTRINWRDLIIFKIYGGIQVNSYYEENMIIPSIKLETRLFLED